MRLASRGTGEIVAELYPLLEPGVRVGTRIVDDVDIIEEICGSGLADFCFCHGGSMQNKIAWINDVSGVTHGNSSFIASAQGMVAPTSGSAESYSCRANRSSMTIATGIERSNWPERTRTTPSTPSTTWPPS